MALLILTGTRRAEIAELEGAVALLERLRVEPARRSADRRPKFLGEAEFGNGGAAALSRSALRHHGSEREAERRADQQDFEPGACVDERQQRENQTACGRNWNRDRRQLATK